MKNPFVFIAEHAWAGALGWLLAVEHTAWSPFTSLQWWAWFVVMLLMINAHDWAISQKEAE